MSTVTSEAMLAATNWYVQLSSGEFTLQEREKWRAWLNASQQNQEAWRQVEAVTNSFMGLDAKTSMAVLSRSTEARQKSSLQKGRRQVIRNLGLLFVVGTTGWCTYKAKPWYEVMADYTTGVGEIRHITLADGTRLTLNTDTKVSLHYDDEVRHIRLLQGEAHIETAHEQRDQYRPFILTTEHGSVKALGTRFSTRIYHERSCVNVYEDAVEVRPVDGYGDKVVVRAGQTIKFNSTLFQKKVALDSSTDAWMRGFIIADKMKLEEFVQEIARYRPGVLRCDPSVSDLEISGAFPLKDVDATLTSISKTLPVKIEAYTRYWTMIKPAATNVDDV